MNFNRYIEQKILEEPLFRKAFIHKSYKNRLPHHETNETLESVGDKALDLVLYDYLYKNSGGKIHKEDMDNLRKEKCSQEGFVPIFDLHDLQKYAEFFDPKQPISGKVKHNFVESLAGAIFLIEGYEVARDILLKFFLYPEQI